jgi:hypothetical protein
MTRSLKIRFPNESSWCDTQIDMDLFIRTREFDDEVFGWYDGTYISILKKSIDNVFEEGN